MCNGIRVLMLAGNNLAHDARVRKKTQTVAKSGFNVVAMGVGAEIPEDLIDAPRQIALGEASRHKEKSLALKWGDQSNENLIYGPSVQRRHSKSFHLCCLGGRKHHA